MGSVLGGGRVSRLVLSAFSHLFSDSSRETDDIRINRAAHKRELVACRAGVSPVAGNTCKIEPENACTGGVHVLVHVDPPRMLTNQKLDSTRTTKRRAQPREGQEREKREKTHLYAGPINDGPKPDYLSNLVIRPGGRAHEKNVLVKWEFFRLPTTSVNHTSCPSAFLASFTC